MADEHVVEHLDLREKAEQFQRGPLGPKDGREAVPPGNVPETAVGYAAGEQSGPSSVTGAEQPRTFESPFRSRTADE